MKLNKSVQNFTKKLTITEEKFWTSEFFMFKKIKTQHRLQATLAPATTVLWLTWRSTCIMGIMSAALMFDINNNDAHICICVVCRLHFPKRTFSHHHHRFVVKCEIVCLGQQLSMMMFIFATLESTYDEKKQPSMNSETAVTQWIMLILNWTICIKFILIANNV